MRAEGDQLVLQNRRELTPAEAEPWLAKLLAQAQRHASDTPELRQRIEDSANGPCKRSVDAKRNHVRPNGTKGHFKYAPVLWTGLDGGKLKAPVDAASVRKMEELAQLGHSLLLASEAEACKRMHAFDDLYPLHGELLGLFGTDGSIKENSAIVVRVQGARAVARR